MSNRDKEKDSQWFYARRGSIARRGKEDLRGIKEAIKKRMIGPDDLLLPPGEGEQWRRAKDLPIFRHHLKSAARTHPSICLIALLILTAAAICYWIVLPIMEYLQPRELSGEPPEPWRFETTSNSVVALVTEGQYDEAWQTLDDARRYVTSNDVAFATLSNLVVQAETLPKIRRAIKQENTDTAKAHLVVLTQSGLTADRLNDFSTHIAFIENKRAAMSALREALAQDIPQRRRISEAANRCVPYIGHAEVLKIAEQMVQDATTEAPSPALAVAYLYAENGNTNKAISAATRFKELSKPENTTKEHLLETIALLREQGASAAAEKALLAANEMWPESYRILIEMAATALEKEDSKNTVEMIKAAVSFGGDTARDMIQKDSRFDEARNWWSFKRAVK